MSDSHKTFWWNVHKKSSYKLYAGNCKLLPLAFFAIVFDIVSNGIFIHANGSMVTYSDTVGILAKVINDGLRTVKGLLAMRNPVFVIAGIEKIFEGIYPTLAPRCLLSAVKFIDSR